MSAQTNRPTAPPHRPAASPGRPFTIGEAARYVGIPVRRLRYLDSIGQVPAARRSLALGYRLYQPEDLIQLRILLAEDPKP